MVTTVDGIPVGGSVGADTFGRNRYGAYVRRRTKPVNPSSTRQGVVRGQFGGAVSNWNTALTAPQRQAWRDWAAATPWLNRAGETVHLSGQAAYIRLGAFLQDAGLSLGIAVDAPPTPVIPTISIASATMIYDISTPNWIITLNMNGPSNTWDDGDGNSKIVVDISTPMSTGRQFKPNLWRRLTTDASGGMSSSYIFTMALASMPFTYDIAGGQHVWLRARGFGALTNGLTTMQVIGPVLTTTQP